MALRTTLTLKHLMAILEFQGVTQTAILLAIQTVNRRAEMVSSVLTVVVGDMQDAAPVKNDILDNTASTLLDNASLSKGIHDAVAQAQEMSDATSQLVALLKAELAPVATDPPDELGRWVN